MFAAEAAFPARTMKFHGGAGERVKKFFFFEKQRLTFSWICVMIIELRGTAKGKNRSRTSKACGLVAQLDRVFDYESKGRGFESRRAHQVNPLKRKALTGFLFVFGKVKTDPFHF